MTHRTNYLNAAGALLFIGGLQWFMTVIAAESIFPGYTTRANDLSDLASTVLPNTSPIQLPAAMFNATTFLFGLLALISAFLIYRAWGDRDRLFAILLALSGLAGMAVGIFPGDTGTIHGLVALAWFVAAPLSAIAAYRFEKKPFAYFSVLIGIFALVVLLLAFLGGGSSPFFLAFGRGGEERMIAYPVVIWMIGLGGYLMSSPLVEAE